MKKSGKRRIHTKQAPYVQHREAHGKAYRSRLRYLADSGAEFYLQDSFFALIFICANR